MEEHITLISNGQSSYWDLASIRQSSLVPIYRGHSESQRQLPVRHDAYDKRKQDGNGEISNSLGTDV